MDMAYQGPVYGLSRECQIKAEAKFEKKLAVEAVNWVAQVTRLPNLKQMSLEEEETYTQNDFADALKDGTALCHLMNELSPGLITKINTLNSPFKQRENIEFFLKACVKYGLRDCDVFQVNDLYERKNLYMVVNCLHALGGMAQKKGYQGPVIGVKVAQENPREFSKEKLQLGQTIIGYQAGSNRGANQSRMTPYGLSRQIMPDGK